MEIIAKTGEGFLIQASSEEVREIIAAVTGSKPPYTDIKIGGRIPALDYASSIRKVKGLSESHEFTELSKELDRFNKSFAKLNQAIEEAKSLS